MCRSIASRTHTHTHTDKHTKISIMFKDLVNFVLRMWPSYVSFNVSISRASNQFAGLVDTISFARNAYICRIQMKQNRPNRWGICSVYISAFRAFSVGSDIFTRAERMNNTQNTAAHNGHNPDSHVMQKWRPIAGQKKIFSHAVDINTQLIREHIQNNQWIRLIKMDKLSMCACVCYA